MIIRAVRDDGALLVADAGSAYLVDESGVLPVLEDSLLARGTWDDPEPGAKVPPAAVALIKARNPLPLSDGPPVWLTALGVFADKNVR
jgi:hypothetical protein